MVRCSYDDITFCLYSSSNCYNFDSKRKKICHLTTAVSARPISRLKVIDLLKLSILEQFYNLIMDNKIKSNYN
jgi:hypothetical protein